MFLPKPSRHRKPRDTFPPGLAARVVDRDRRQWYLLQRITVNRPCIAPLVDSSEWGRCSGRSTIQHVKTGVGMVPRIHREEMLLTLCEGHHLETHAGANWATAHMAEQRRYLARLYPQFWKEHSPADHT